ncbi:MAG: minichromosome maintenance protein MCM [Candidatus Diapherotrites archaeon]|nr:minichromosome maintenance protein MCM [Candidatus Diapherotrites archaeon]
MADGLTVIENTENPFVARFAGFFETVYKKKIERIVADYPEKRSLNIDFKELEKFDFELADELIDQPDILLEAASEAIQGIDIPALEIEEFKPNIRFYNLPKDRNFLIKEISSSHLNKLIAVEGVVRQITDVMPKITVAFWECKRCGNTYRILQDSQQLVQPTMCECKHRDFKIVNEKSEFIDYQKIQIQEPLEKLKGSEQAAYVDIFVADDIVHQITAGDKTLFVGILRLTQSKSQGQSGKYSTVYGRYMEAVHLEETAREFEEVEITPEEEEEIKKLAKDPKIYDMLIQSVAPAIYGHESVKESVVLQMFGGVKKHLPNKQTIRGNIHILLVGDPSVGKSQILQAADHIAPKSIYFTGKAASGVGLTASAVKDDFGDGGWTLKAGALVLANGGVCMADELDKMDAEDRTALHEGMEQGTVSVAKAGIVTRFKADTSILAAANPKLGRFDPYSPFIDQVNLPPTLISRFDLFFMIRDVLDRTKDEALANHILRTHKAGETLSQYKQQGRAIEEETAKEISAIAAPIISPEILTKYISYARQRIFPIMSKEAIERISTFYVNLREQGKKEGGSYSATHRQLEGLVRLCEASARVRLSNEANEEDADRALRLLKVCLEDLVTDPETGKIDFDIITMGTTHTQQTNMKTLLHLVREKAKEMDMVPLQDVLLDAKDKGIDDEKARDLLKKLEDKGELYRPRHGFIKPTQKERQ